MCLCVQKEKEKWLGGGRAEHKPDVKATTRRGVGVGGREEGKEEGNRVAGQIECRAQ